MKLTNRMQLPQPLVDAVANDPYTRGDADISVTQLIQPPRKVALDAIHKDELSEDASDRIWSLLGQSIHAILERSASVGVSERRLSIQVEGWKVSGATDYYLDGLAQDYKISTVWKFKNDEVPVEHIQQLNMLSEIMRQNGHAVSKLQIVGILRDWSKMEAQRDPGYPQAQVIVRNVPLWPSAQAQAFIRERVLLHRQARHELPECSPMERWQKPDMWAVMKLGGKRAVKLCTNHNDALTHVASDKSKTLFIVKRAGEATRCRSYCGVSSFCDQYQKELAQLKESMSEPTEPLASAVG